MTTSRRDALCEYILQTRARREWVYDWLKTNWTYPHGVPGLECFLSETCYWHYDSVANWLVNQHGQLMLQEVSRASPR